MSDELPETLAQIRADFHELEIRERLQLLLEFANELPELPARYAEHPDLLERVDECQSPVFIFVEVDDHDIVHLFATAPKEAPTTRGFASILVQGLAGLTVQEVLDIPDDFPAGPRADRGGEPVAGARDDRTARAGETPDSREDRRVIVRRVFPTAGEPIDLDVPDARDLLTALYEPSRPGQVRLNLIGSVSGSATGSDGTSETLTNSADRMILKVIRSLADVVVVGAATVRAEGYFVPRSAALAVVTRTR